MNKNLPATTEPKNTNAQRRGKFFFVKKNLVWLIHC
jgi:hypothetical protein